MIDWCDSCIDYDSCSATVVSTCIDEANGEEYFGESDDSSFTVFMSIGR